MRILPARISNFKFQISNLQSGFTLVELLVVIGVLGILASGLLATVDPLEQFRKASDSNKSQTALELVNALQRYYAVHGAFPWAASTAGGDATCNTDASATIVNAGGIKVDGPTKGAPTAFESCMAVLIAEGELKSTFTDQNGILRYLSIVDYSAGTDKKFRVCYDPESKSVSRNANTKYAPDALNSLTPGCVPTAADAVCMVCVE